MLKIFSVGTNAFIGMSEHGLSHPFKYYGAVGNGLTGIIKCIRNVSLHFQLEPNTLGFLIVPTDKNLNNCGLNNWGLHSQNLVFSDTF